MIKRVAKRIALLGLALTMVIVQFPVVAENPESGNPAEAVEMLVVGEELLKDFEPDSDPSVYYTHTLDQGVDKLPDVEVLFQDGYDPEDYEIEVVYMTNSIPYYIGVGVNEKGQEEKVIYTIKLLIEGVFDGDYVPIESAQIKDDYKIIRLGETFFPEIVDITPTDASSKIIEARLSRGEVDGVPPESILEKGDRNLVAVKTGKGKVVVTAQDSLNLDHDDRGVPTPKFEYDILDEMTVYVVDEYIPADGIQVEHENLVVEQDTITIYENKKYGMTISTLPADATITDLILEYDSDMLYIDGDKIIGLNTGTHQITIRSPGVDVERTIQVEVKPFILEEIRVRTPRDTLEVTDSTQLSYELVNDVPGVELKWESANTGTATVDEEGVVTAISPGVATIMLSEIVEGETGIFGEVEITVVPYTIDSIEIGNVQDIMHIGQSQNLPEYKIVPDKGKHHEDITWVTDNSSVISVDGAYIEARSEGTASIKLQTVGGVESEPITLTVMEKPEIKTAENTVELYLESSRTVRYEVKGSEDELVYFAIGNTDIVTTSAESLEGPTGEVTLTAISSGETTLMLSNGSGLYAEVTVVVIDQYELFDFGSIKITTDDTELIENSGSLELKFTTAPTNLQPRLRWESSNTKAVTVDETGKVYPVAEGEATITVHVTNSTRPIQDSIKITVVKEDPVEDPKPGPGKEPGEDSDDEVITNGIKLENQVITLLLEKTERIRYEIIGDIGTTVLYFNPVTPEDIVHVNDNGVVTALNPGKATITVHNGRTGRDRVETKVTVHVLDAYEYFYVRSLEITNNEQELQVGEEFELKYTIQPASSREAKVLYSTTNSKIATVNEDGVVTAVAPGEVEIVAYAYETSALDKIKIKVNPYVKPATSIKLDTQVKMIVGALHKIDVEITPEDTTQTTLVFKTDSNLINLDSKGTVFALNPGTAEVEVSIKGTEIKQTVTIEVAYPESYWKDAGEINNVIERKNIVLRFSTPINEKTLKDNVFISKDASGNGEVEDIKFTLENNGRRLVVNAPDDGWETGGTYHLFLRNGLSDTFGNRIGAQAVYQLNIRN